MIEHTMPLMEPAAYEAAVLQVAFDRNGEVVRWYISRVDEAAATVTAEVVMLSSLDSLRS
jgi:hypothetical protein